MKRMRTGLSGFSLVELIVVIVIMAILMAALVPSMVGYIRQSRRQEAKEGASSCVKAAQIIVSSAYAEEDGVYHGKYDLDFREADNTFAIPADQTDFLAEVKYLAEVNGRVYDVEIDENCRIKQLKYETADKKSVASFDGSGYTVS